MEHIADAQITERLFPEEAHAAITSRPTRYTMLGQMMRFGMVGVVNTGIDIGTLNLLLWRFPTHNANVLLAYNSVAFLLGALNSFLLNKSWTFQAGRAFSGKEILRFVCVHVAAAFFNDSLIWVVGRGLHPFIANVLLWGNASKLCAALGTMLITYFAMRLWVFAGVAQPAYQVMLPAAPPVTTPAESAEERSGASCQEAQPAPGNHLKHPPLTPLSLSVILPAHNEEAIIAYTVKKAISFLSRWVRDLEVLVVNDGSTDQTKTIVEELALAYPCVRLINHPVNQGYGAALVSGFEAASKDVIFFMDADGQFDIRDLAPFFPLLEGYDAVLGYRIARQDTAMRKFNAWGWKLLIRATLGVCVRDVDCAFKLFRAEFFRTQRLETRGAMINTEILYKWTRAGYTYTQMGVHHFPRIGGRATGAKPAVILRALKELAVCAWKWRLEEARSFQTKITVRL